MTLDWKHSVQNDWTLMLDRDGVINRRIIDGYVTSWAEFEFLPGALDALRVLSQHFRYIFVITNQQGVGKRLMTMEQLDGIHDQMCEVIEEHGGHIDGIFVCPQLDSDPDNYRKPNPRMAYMAQEIAPDLDLNKCIMVGDSKSDIEFGHNAGMYTVFIGNKCQEADDNYESLLLFSQVFSS